MVIDMDALNRNAYTTSHNPLKLSVERMIKAGARVIYVQARLGQASVATANEYVTERDAVAEQINRFAPEVGTDGKISAKRLEKKFQILDLR